MKTLIAPTPTDRTHVLVERDLLEMDLLVQISTSAQRMEARVTTTQSVLMTRDHFPVTAKMASQEMGLFVLISMSVWSRVRAMKTLTASTPTDLTHVLA